MSHIVNNNRLLFSIIIHNLLDNAIKNTASGKIILSSGIRENKVYFEIEDSGAGMSAELVHLYNNKKIQFRTEKDEKAGMGLQIITELLEIMKGKMKIESSAVFGTKITITFSNPKTT